jgi:hypothetical protein
LSRAASLLGRLSPLQSLDLTNTQVADLGPLKGLSALHSLDLITRVHQARTFRGACLVLASRQSCETR